MPFIAYATSPSPRWGALQLTETLDTSSIASEAVVPDGSEPRTLAQGVAKLGTEPHSAAHSLAYTPNRCAGCTPGTAAPLVLGVYCHTIAGGAST
jgi:hypothetical protein